MLEAERIPAGECAAVVEIDRLTRPAGFDGYPRAALRCAE